VCFIWALSSPERLSKKATAALQKTSAIRELSSISLSEIAIKSSVGKLNFAKDDVRLALSDLQLRVLPYTGDHAFRLFELPLHHTDPFDRQIIAQALVEQIPIITCDSVFKSYKGVEVIW